MFKDLISDAQKMWYGHETTTPTIIHSNRKKRKSPEKLKLCLLKTRKWLKRSLARWGWGAEALRDETACEVRDCLQPRREKQEWLEVCLHGRMDKVGFINSEWFGKSGSDAKLIQRESGNSFTSGLNMSVILWDEKTDQLLNFHYSLHCTLSA